jgi:hypothetical protein
MSHVESPSALDLACQIDAILRNDTSLNYWSVEDVLSKLLDDRFFDAMLNEYRCSGDCLRQYMNPTRENDLFIVKDLCADKIKKAKSGLRSGLKAYGWDFETCGGKTRGQKFRYPQSLNFNPVEAWQRKQKIFSQALEYKYSKAVEGKFRQYIDEQRVVEFDCVPSFDRNTFFSHVVIHPHHIREYNGRLFLFGKADLKTYKSASKQMEYKFEAGNFPLDRIDEDSIKVIPNQEFIPSQIDYTTFFDDIVGVTHYTDNDTGKIKFPVEKIMIKTHDPYAHGRMVTRPLHKSQVEEQPFDDEEGFGLISITVSYNKELLGVIFNYEGSIEVISPKCVRDEITMEVDKMYKHYHES